MRLIDADALIKQISYTASLGGWIGEALEEIKKVAIRYIDCAPTIDAESVRRGRWEEIEVVHIEETVIDEWQSACCSVCGKYHTTPYMYYFNDYEYCPSCGAKMESDHD